MVDVEVGRVSALMRYPVKSMAGQPLESARVNWHGIEGDRRLGFRRRDDRGGFPWLTGRQVPEMLLFAPFGSDERAKEPTPTHVRTPDGEELELWGAPLRDDLARRHGGEIDLIRLDIGVFDDADLSVITPATVAAVARGAGAGDLDWRRFRPNVLVETFGGEPFGEDAWVGGTLRFGDADSGAAVSLTKRDGRCVMLNVDPETAERNAAVLKTVGRANAGTAGVYGKIVRLGEIRVGQSVWLERR